MCLTIDEKYHAKRGQHYVPLIAPRPLVVVKVVSKGGWNQYYSPFMGTNIHLEKFQFRRIKTYFHHADCSQKGMRGRVEEGFHCFLYNISRDTIEHRLWFGNNSKKIYGVIPTGAKYFRGRNKEVVTEQIIYFDTLADVKAYFNVEKLDKGHKDPKVNV